MLTFVYFVFSCITKYKKGRLTQQESIKIFRRDDLCKRIGIGIYESSRKFRFCFWIPFNLKSKKFARAFFNIVDLLLAGVAPEIRFAIYIILNKKFISLADNKIFQTVIGYID